MDLRPELVVWVLVHGLGFLVNMVSVVKSLNLASKEGSPAVPLTHGLVAVCAALIHAVSIVQGTEVISRLPPHEVWGYAIFQGTLFLTIGASNLWLLKKEPR
jgi:predicted membrane channel-forming protein YqfA (hemolysin III family)